jgi:ubiquinone/menaquinone biosynthesis C-methylase UbiE
MTDGLEESHYDDAPEGWATGAALVYAPLARELVARSPHPLAGRRVLDVGAGTGVGSEALRAVGARPVALDLSWPMLTWHRSERPPCAVASVNSVPVADASVDDVFASFVLNHVSQPVAAMADLARAVRSGGALLATTFSAESKDAARDRVDEVVAERGWRAPDWYVAMKESTIPLLGSSMAMADAAAEAGLARIAVEERPVDVGVERPHELVSYRLGQAQFTEFLGSLDAAGEAALRAEAADAIAPIMQPYRPTVVFLAALVP